ncbi:MAG: radical SAM protein [Elusimicrobiota bacterium]
MAHTTPAGPAIAYRRRGETHLNISNRCPARCGFCLRRVHGMFFAGRDMGLGAREPNAKAVLAAIDEAGGPGKALVFSGFGEPTYRTKVLSEVGREAFARWPGIPRRLETIGLGSRLNGRDIVPELLDSVDSVSVSLDTCNPQAWLDLHVPWDAFRRRGLEDCLDFIRACAAAGLATTVTAVDLPDNDWTSVSRLAQTLGADFKLLPLVV